MIRKHILGAAALFAAALVAGQASASQVVFADDFNDNDVSDWVFSTNYVGGASGLDTAGVLGPYIDAPPGGNDLTARASKSLNLLEGLYTLDFDAFTINCSGCTVSYDVLLDGVSQTRTPTFGATEHRQLDLGSLSAGAHTLTLGMHTTNASSGHFLATFDNVVLTGDQLVSSAAPEPAAWAMMLGGFFGMGALLRRRNNDKPGQALLA